MTEHPLHIDHIVIAVDDLKKAARVAEDLLGLAVAGGGRHDGAGTENAILPMGESYLELVTVVDPREAGRHPFGALVAGALREDRPLAAWCVALPAPRETGGVRLTRAGVDVLLYDVEQATADSARPFALHRGPEQQAPGARIAGTRSWRVEHLRTGPGGLEAVEIACPDGRVVVIDADTWRTPVTGDGDAALAASLCAVRRDLHAIPEVGLHLPDTQAYLVDRLRAAGIETHLGREGLSSVVAIVRGERPGRSVLVRSDMDGLPVEEHSGEAFAATNGAMHACGHDLHMAIVLHAALVTHERRAGLEGDAIFVFQPGEEGHGGARLMLDQGVLDINGERPVALLGLHVLAHHLPLGAVVTRAGAVLGGSTLLDIELTGVGGHGSAPHLTRSPLNAAADLVTSSLAALPSRIAASETVVLSYGTLRAGVARNVVPVAAELGGVIRSFEAEAGAAVEGLVRTIASATATAHDVRIDVRSRQDTIPTRTDAEELSVLHAVLPGRVDPLDRPLAISEDFSWFLREVPGVFLLVGASTGDPATTPSNHSATATFDESVLLPTTRLVVDWVFARLGAADRVS